MLRSFVILISVYSACTHLMVRFSTNDRVVRKSSQLMPLMRPSRGQEEGLEAGRPFRRGN